MVSNWIAEPDARMSPDHHRNKLCLRLAGAVALLCATLVVGPFMAIIHAQEDGTSGVVPPALLCEEAMTEFRFGLSAEAHCEYRNCGGDHFVSIGRDSWGVFSALVEDIMQR